MKIATFGSCLSRRTAERFKAAFGGSIVTSVYHNRSDAFLDNFVEGKSIPPELDQMAISLGVPLTNDDTTEHTLKNICQNQTNDGIGKHLLPDGRQFVDSIKEDDLDVIIVDNYMDTAAYLWSANVDGQNIKYFANTTPRSTDGVVKDQILSPHKSAVNFSKIMDFLREYQPNTPIVFLVFPYNTYEGNEARKTWALNFTESFQDDRINIVPPLMIPKSMWTEAPSHYKPDMYYAYAGIVRGFMGL